MSVETLTRYVLLREGILESWNMEDLDTLVAVVKLYWINISKDFAVDYLGLPPEFDKNNWKEDAEFVDKSLETLLPGRRLVITFRNIVHFRLDRVRGGDPRLLRLLLVKTPLPNEPDARDEPKTILGFEFANDSELLRELGTYRSHFHHAVIHCVTGRVDIVFEDLETNLPCPPGPTRV